MQLCVKREITLIFLNLNSALFCIFSLSSNAAGSSIPCTIRLKMVVLFYDGFIADIYSFGKKKCKQTSPNVNKPF